MRIVIANCSAVYTGRGDTKLNAGVRAIFIKDDGAISIHNDAGNKPLNYMGKGNVFTESIEDDVLVWRFDTRKENLTLYMHEVISDSDHELILEDEGLVRDGTEKQLQGWIAENPESVGEGFTFVEREFQTGAGPVDLLLKDAEGVPVVVEVKRIAMLTSVDQLGRYVTAIREMEGYEDAYGILAALDVRPNTVKLAEKRGVPYVTLDNMWNHQEETE